MNFFFPLALTTTQSDDAAKGTLLAASSAKPSQLSIKARSKDVGDNLGCNIVSREFFLNRYMNIDVIDGLSFNSGVKKHPRARVGLGCRDEK